MTWGVERWTVGDLADRAAERFRDREALCFRDRRWSFGQFQGDVDRAARGLLALGVRTGEHVALWVPNRPEWLHLFFAVAKIGAVIVPINTRLRTVDLEYVVRQSDSATLVTVDRWGPVGFQEILRELCPELETTTPSAFSSSRCPSLRRVLVLGDRVSQGAFSWSEVVEAGGRVSEGEVSERHAAVAPADTVLIMYTSGTTGFPKGAMHGHGIVRTVADGASRWGMTSRDVILMYLPLFHTFGLYEGVLMFLLTGARMVLMERFDPAEALRLLARERATYLCGFDTHYQDLMDHPAFSATDVRSLRLAFLPAGMASTEAVARRVNRLLCRSVSAYGMTEIGTGACRSFLDAPEDERCLASGYPAPGYGYQVIDPATGRALPPGTPGELCVRGYGVMRGYYNKPEETARTIDGEGWLHTGDRAVMDQDGFIRFMGRYKELLKVGGENVDPLEVEALLLRHSAVSQAKVVGVPDRRLGEVAVACVIPKEGEGVTLEDLLTFCQGKMASFKIPRHVLFLKEYPTTSSGKVQKFLLREQAMTMLGLSPAGSDGDSTSKAE